MKSYFTLLFLLPVYLLAGQLSSKDTLTLNRLLSETGQLNEEKNIEMILSKLDSVVTIASLNKAPHYILPGLAYKGYYAELYNRLDVYYASIKDIEALLEQFKIFII